MYLNYQGDKDRDCAAPRTARQPHRNGAGYNLLERACGLGSIHSVSQSASQSVSRWKEKEEIIKLIGPKHQTIGATCSATNDAHVLSDQRQKDPTYLTK